MIFEGNELDGTVSQANKGQQYAINVTANVVTVDVSDTGNDAVEITQVGPDWNPAQYTTADTYAKIRFKIAPACLQAAAA